jgi:hypothetical protein
MINSITDKWLLGAFFCRFNTFIQSKYSKFSFYFCLLKKIFLFLVLSLIAAISTLSIISYERFTGIVCSMNNKLNRKKSIIIIICIWIFSIIAATPALVYRRQFKRVWMDRIESWCADDWPRLYKINDKNCIDGIDEPLRKIYYTFISCVLFFIPVIIMSICYCLIISKLWGTKIPGENYIEKQLMLKRRKNVRILLLDKLYS